VTDIEKYRVVAAI